MVGCDECALALIGDEPSLRCQPLVISALELLQAKPQGLSAEAFFQQLPSMAAGVQH